MIEYALRPRLLHVPPLETLAVAADTSLTTTSHADERQIRLDTDRSFVLYPVCNTKCHNLTAQD